MIDVFNFTCLNLPELSYNIEMKLHFGTIANIFTIKDSLGETESRKTLQKTGSALIKSFEIF